MKHKSSLFIVKSSTKLKKNDEKSNDKKSTMRGTAGTPAPEFAHFGLYSSK